MAAAVRIEACAFDDPRFAKLAKRAGLADEDHARGKMERVWSYCTDRQCHLLDAEDFDHVARWPGLALAALDAGLAEFDNAEESGLVRVCGTRGRIEWIGKLRKNAAKGGKAKASKPVANGSQAPSKPEPDPCPLTLTLTTPIAKEKRGDVSAAAPADPPSLPRKRKGAAGGATAEEQAAIVAVLAKLSERSGRTYSPGTLPHAKRILRLLRSGYSEEDLRTVVWDRANRWSGDPKMDEYLRPATLFGPEKFADYLAEGQAAWKATPEAPPAEFDFGEDAA